MGKGNLNLGFCGVPARVDPPPPPPPPPAAPNAMTTSTNCRLVPCGKGCPSRGCEESKRDGRGQVDGGISGRIDPNLTLYGSYARTEYDENALNAGRNTPKSNSGAEERYLNQKSVYNQSFLHTANILLGIGILLFSIQTLRRP
jgi:hypothetical protein